MGASITGETAYPANLAELKTEDDVSLLPADDLISMVSMADHMKLEPTPITANITANRYSSSAA
jgi:hypothetical protein